MINNIRIKLNNLLLSNYKFQLFNFGKKNIFRQIVQQSHVILFSSV